MSSALSVFLFASRPCARTRVPLFAQEQTGNRDKATLESQNLVVQLTLASPHGP